MKTLSKSVSKLVKKFSKRAKKTWCAVVAFFQPRATQRLSAKTKRISGKGRKAVPAFASFLALCLLAVPVQAESLWMKAGSKVDAHYADHRALRAGDILTVLIKETTNITASKETKAQKTASITDSITQWFFGSQNHKNLNGVATGTNNYDGKGNITDQQSVNAGISVMVTDVLPNGNLLIEGIRSLDYSNEKQYMVLQGLVRPDDVLADNTVLSTQIANATIDIKEEGDLSSAQRKGWLMKLNDFIGPF